MATDRKSRLKLDAARAAAEDRARRSREVQRYLDECAADEDIERFADFEAASRELRNLVAEAEQQCSRLQAAYDYAKELQQRLFEHGIGGRKEDREMTLEDAAAARQIADRLTRVLTTRPNDDGAKVASLPRAIETLSDEDYEQDVVKWGYSEFHLELHRVGMLLVEVETQIMVLDYGIDQGQRHLRAIDLAPLDKLLSKGFVRFLRGEFGCKDLTMRLTTRPAWRPEYADVDRTWYDTMRRLEPYAWQDAVREWHAT